MNFAVFGAGAWGTAMAVHLERCGHAVTLVPRREAHLTSLRQTRVNSDYLPDIPLSEKIEISEFGADLVERAEVCILAAPSFALRSWCDAVARAGAGGRLSGKTMVSLSKGLEQKTLKMPSEILVEAFPEGNLAVLSGPNFAMEVARGQPTAGVIAGTGDGETLEMLQEAMSSPLLRFYRSRDIIGVELGGCLKNIYAIAAGICEGLELGENAKSALMTRSLHEMVGIVTRLGGLQETVYGLSGFGDLVATSFGRLSRNRSLGEALGRGQSLDRLMDNRKTVVEGYWACQCFHDLCSRRGFSAPIMEQIYGVLFQRRTPVDALKELMMRQLKEEHPMGQIEPAAHPGEREAPLLKEQD